MKLFEMKDWKLKVEEQTWALAPFKKLLEKDKSKDKERAVKEIAFVWYYCDIKSDYQYLINLEERFQEIKKDLKLPSAWKITKDIKAAIDFYNERSTTVSSKILKDSLHIANKLSSQMKKLVDDDENPLNGATITKLIAGLKQMPDVIKSLQETEKAVLREIQDNKKTIGSQQKGFFEDGFDDL